MEHIKILNSREKKELQALLKQQWGFSKKLEYVFLLSRKNKLYLIHGDVGSVDLSPLRVDSLGLYFGELQQGQLRLSIEGSQLIGKECKKKVVEVSPAMRKQWLMGKDLELGIGGSGFVILHCEQDYLGCGKLQNGTLLNYIPKARRIRAE